MATPSAPVLAETTHAGLALRHSPHCSIASNFKGNRCHAVVRQSVIRFAAPPLSERSS